MSTIEEIEGMPTRTVSGPLGHVGADGELFPYHRDETRWPAPDDPENAVAYVLELPHRGDLEVTRSGPKADGPWAVDLYRDDHDPSTHLLTPEQARTWARALLGAADLADRFNRDGLPS